GTGFGLIWDLIVGLIGAFIGDWLLPRLGIHLGTGIVALTVNAFIGAVVLLLILRLVSGWRGGPRWGAQVVISHLRQLAKVLARIIGDQALSASVEIITGPKVECRIPRRP